MRHRAQRTLLNRLLPSGHHRRVTLVAAGLASVLAATGAGLAVAGDQDSDARPSASADFPPATYPVRTPTGTERSPDVSRGAQRPSNSATPSPSPTPSESAPSPTVAPGESTTPSPRITATASVSVNPNPAPSAPADADPPQTTASTSSAAAGTWVIALAADEPSSFECSLDGGAYQPCGATATFPDLDGGKHTLAARATDDAGNTDASPVQLTAKMTGPR